MGMIGSLLGTYAESVKFFFTSDESTRRAASAVPLPKVCVPNIPPRRPATSPELAMHAMGFTFLLRRVTGRVLASSTSRVGHDASKSRSASEACCTEVSRLLVVSDELMVVA